MKINKEKINQFFEADKFGEDIKEFVLDILELLFKESKDLYSAKILLQQVLNEEFPGGEVWCDFKNSLLETEWYEEN